LSRSLSFTLQEVRMSPIIAGLGLILLGLVGAFLGYRIFRVLLPIYGGVAGFLLAWGWWGDSAWLLALIVGVVLAVVFAVLAYAFWSAMVAFGGLIMGGAIGVVIGTSLNLWDWLTVLMAIGLAIVFAALFFWIRNEMVIISTAVTGGTLVARGVGEMFGWRSGLEGNINAGNPTWLSILVLAVGIVVFIAGLLFQWRAYAKLRWYSSKGAPAPTVDSTSPAVQGAATRTAASIDAAAGPAGAAVTGGGAAVAGAATAAATAAVVTTRGAAEDVAADASGAAADVAATAGDVVSDAGEAVTDAAGGAVDAAEGGLAAAGAAAVGVAAAVGDDASDVAEDAEVAVDAAGEAVADVAGDVAEGAAGAVVAAGAVLADAGDEVADAGEAAENKVEDVVDSAAKTLDVEIDENKVANALAELEKSFEGLEESAKFKEALDFIEGIGPVFAAKLKDIGVNNVLDLLRSGATRKGRADLAEKSGIAGKQILEWVNHADLYRVKGVGSEFADLLEAAGVDTVPELAQRNPAKLLEKMLATNEEKRLVRRSPHPSEVEDWVSQAKSLPRIIQY
jgi:predicted flap endonuclease-1-like 5' DNA nuclease